MITLRNGEFQVAASDMLTIQKELERLAASDDRRVHSAFAAKIFGPIRTKATFEEVYDVFYQTQPVAPGEIVRIAQADYIGVAYFTSPDGQAMFVRPGRKYATIVWKMVDTGMEFHWDDLAEAGWPMLSFYMSQAAEELARKRDGRAKTVLDASIAGQAGHTITAYDKMTRSAVDSVIRAASDDKFPITFAVVAPSTAMDMAYWTSPSNSLWRTPDELGTLIIQQGHISNYGGIAWIVKRFASTTSVYFGGVPGDNGQWRFQKGGVRKASDVDITKRLDRYVWDEKWAHYIDGGQANYKITIS